MLCFLFNQIREHESRTGCAKKWEVEGCLAQIMYTYISKCKNDKIKERKKKTFIMPGPVLGYLYPIA
jgi:hypothetical protein